MKKLIFSAVLMAVSVSAQAATFNNGSFENGLTGWNTYTPDGGGVNVKSFDEGYYATSGDKFANLQATSTISQFLNWEQGESITFDWAFNAKDYAPFNDFSFLSLTNSVGNLLDNVLLSSVLTTGNYGQTDWAEYKYTFTNAGSGFLSVGVKNLFDSALDSELNVDNFQGASVPEPASIALFGLGLLGFGFSRKFQP